jgi:hypothetical protein
LLSIENPKIFLVNLVVYPLLCYFENTKKNRTMAQKKLGEYATPNEDYIRAPITHPLLKQKIVKLSLII